ncbi:hypothetical protein [Usitatibacter palustris]|uniref:Uncharacterized protein n=1 Tax=Usitatibacter palustris TaxID=2732487 RepID=A0A6M4H6K0_9PROT|nr:hypothetical protein [Usitatibacter palustris]QJR14982.1 hypothetical protein DSM104440_01797 [Usitatibacter palustris]
MKQWLAVMIACGGALLNGGCASSTGDTDPNAIPKIDQDTKVYNTGSRIGRPDRGYETPTAPAKPAAPAQPAANNSVTAK